MSDTITLAAETRDRVGKGASRALRRDGRVPAVIYGQNKEPTSIHLEEKALVKALMTGHFMNSVIMVDGKRTLAKDVAFHPVTDRPLHVDFLRIAAHETVTVPVPVVIVDEEESPGVKKGAVLTLVATELEVTVDAADIPSQITVSVKGKDVGDTIHIGDVRVPKGATLTIEDPDFTVATLVAPSAMLAEAQEQAAEEAALAEAASAEAAAEAEAAADDAEGEDKGE
ncbi:MAG: 50S ribosomal protein L25/general stress protein Ctc [Sphingomonas adhaesiva]|uniref:50S ribosomal protein L25/general stress protein Ctc n=1 Tax=Sphingomonas adhaesiva TaxID=28212 RepID=UPI002FF4C30E